MHRKHGHFWEAINVRVGDYWWMVCKVVNFFHLTLLRLTWHRWSATASMRAFSIATWLSVCLSHWCIVPKQLSRSSCDLHHIVTLPYLFSRTKYAPDSSRAPPSLRASNGRGVGKSRKIRPINCSIQQRAALDSTAWCAQLSGGLSATAELDIPLTSERQLAKDAALFWNVRLIKHSRTTAVCWKESLVIHYYAASNAWDADYFNRC